MPPRSRKKGQPRRPRELEPGPVSYVAESEAEIAQTMDELVGRHVAHWRRRAGMTRPELAEAMVALGFGWLPQTVEQIERGTRRLAWDELLVLAAYFSVTPWELLVESGRLYPVRLGKNVIGAKEWPGFWDGETPAALEEIVSGLDRPWARALQRGSKSLEGAYREAREEILSARSRHPGPTYVLTDAIKSFEQKDLGIKVTKGVPYVARDDFEAEVLFQAEQRGDVRRISNQEAYRIRKRLAKQTAKKPRTTK